MRCMKVPLSILVAVLVPLLNPLLQVYGVEDGVLKDMDTTSTVIEVDAIRLWQSTGVDVVAGEPVRMEVTDGLWTDWVGVVPYNNGVGTDYICADFLPPSDCTEPMPHARKGSLIAKIGSQLLAVGSGATIIPEQSGILYMQINDGEDPDERADNDGVLTVEITTEGPSIVGEARLDMGMPYNADRGCASPYAGCSGPFHGFYAGVCTDLALDAYRAGVPFDIQNSLYQDHLSNLGRYRYGTARNAEDMKRYFLFNQGLLSHSQPYELGDIAFFDWTGDGLSNHVNIISGVDTDGRPIEMVDATGVYPGNPSGRALEHNWSGYYDQHSQGHARLGSSGANRASEALETEMLQILRVQMNSSSVALRLSDANGKSISKSYDENLVASNVESFIPYIPGGSYTNLGTQKAITVAHPLLNTSQYFVHLEGQADVTYNLLIETLDSVVSDSQLLTNTIRIGESQKVGITLSNSNEGLKFTASPPAPSPSLSIPDSLNLNTVVGTSTQLVFNVAEKRGQEPISDVSISVTDFSNQLGEMISGSKLSISPSDFSVLASSTQSVTVQIDVDGLEPGVYQGSLVLTSQNAGKAMIPFTVEIRFHNIHLPVIMGD